MGLILFFAIQWKKSDPLNPGCWSWRRASWWRAWWTWCSWPPTWRCGPPCTGTPGTFTSAASSTYSSTVSRADRSLSPSITPCIPKREVRKAEDSKIKPKSTLHKLEFPYFKWTKTEAPEPRLRSSKLPKTQMGTNPTIPAVDDLTKLTRSNMAGFSRKITKNAVYRCTHFRGLRNFFKGLSHEWGLTIYAQPLF